MKDRFGVLDGMRGIAVLLVLWYHLWEISWQPAPASWLQWIPETGFIGVPLFFFLSGFVITFPFVRARLAGEPQPTWGHFAWRRFIKIMPSYVLSIIIAYAIGYAAVNHAGAPVWKEVLTHLLFIHTWWYATYGSINGVLWTLAVEVEFYLVFPLVWWCFARRPILTTAGMILIAMLWRVHAAQCCFHYEMPLMVENLPGYLDIFAAGMFSAWIFARFGHRLRAPGVRLTMPLLASAGAVLFAGLMIWMFDHRYADEWEVSLQIYARPLFGLAFAAIAVGMLASPPLWQTLLANAPLRFLAFISYNLYLYHQMVARLMVTYDLPPHGATPHAEPVWMLHYTILAFVITIAQAAAVTYWFERPLLRLPQPRLKLSALGHSS
ncbi:MAG TPA: acyltransferase [Candidatus Acidoferrales bacterium]|nr:acyltransferase [Candidatus Acidoferrales bacterium]